MSCHCVPAHGYTADCCSCPLCGIATYAWTGAQRTLDCFGIVHTGSAKVPFIGESFLQQRRNILKILPPDSQVGRSSDDATIHGRLNLQVDTLRLQRPLNGLGLDVAFATSACYI